MPDLRDRMDADVLGVPLVGAGADGRLRHRQPVLEELLDGDAFVVRRLLLLLPALQLPELRPRLSDRPRPGGPPATMDDERDFEAVALRVDAAFAIRACHSNSLRSQ